MAFKKWFGRRKHKKEIILDTQEQDRLDGPSDEPEEKVNLEKEHVDLKNKMLRLDYIQRLYEGIKEAKRQCQDIKVEYGQVTSYLKDIQLMDQAPEEDKAALYETAKAIVELTKERESLKRRKYKFTDAQKQAMENFEPKVEKDLGNLKEYEDYQMKIQHDMRHLESEKRLLLTDKRDIVRRQSTLRLVSKVLGFMLALFGVLLLTIWFVFEVDIQVPFLATISFALAVSFIIIIESRKNRTDMVITERKCNRAVSLANRVKIKYVNNTKPIDYMHSKYKVRNATGLEFVYDQYRKAKREWARQREDAFLLNEKNEILMQELEGLGVKDKDIWFHQANAIVEPKEMVEVRHSLNERRQKLRDQIDYNNGIMQDFLRELERIRNKSPEYAQEIEELLKFNE